MNIKDLLSYRLYNQQISHQSFTTPAEVVHWMGAIQAQDYPGAKWSIALRLPKTTETGIEKALAERKIVRTWPMRGTLHFVAPEDVRWMLKLLTPRVTARMAAQYRSGLDNKIFAKCRKLFVAALQGDRQLTRDELYQLLQKNKIATTEQRGLHILAALALEGLICFGARRGKQQTFALLDEWIPAGKSLNPDEALATLIKRYFISHGPATIQDLAWWSGLTIAELKRGLEMVKTDLQQQELNGKIYRMSASMPDVKSKPGTYLLPGFDEYMVAYKDRTAAVDQKYSKKILNVPNGIFAPTIVINGKVEATWKRSFEKKEVIIKVRALSSLSKARKDSIRIATGRFSKFLGNKPRLVIK